MPGSEFTDFVLKSKFLALIEFSEIMKNYLQMRHAYLLYEISINYTFEGEKLESYTKFDHHNSEIAAENLLGFPISYQFIERTFDCVKMQRYPHNVQRCYAI